MQRLCLVAAQPLALFCCSFGGRRVARVCHFKGSVSSKVLQIVLLACQLQAVLDSVAWQRLPVFLLFLLVAAALGMGVCKVVLSCNQ